MSSRENPNVGLRQVVGAEREELRLGGNLVGGHRAARHFDHRAHEVVDLHAVLLHRLGRDAIDDRLLVLQLLHVADERNHDLRERPSALPSSAEWPPR